MSVEPVPERLYFHIEGRDFIRGIILKVHVDCNYACIGCYAFDSEGEKWRDRPPTMSPQFIIDAAKRTREYMDEVRLRDMTIILHGGEPLLAKMKTIRFIVDTFREVIGHDRIITFKMQTNGSLVTEKTAKELAQLGIQVSVSIDGDERGNAKRLFRSGRSTYPVTVRGIKHLKSQNILSRLLAVIHLDNDPAETAKALLALHDKVDCLFPIATWQIDELGNVREEINEPTSRPTTSQTPLADWLIRFHQSWCQNGGLGKDIRFFDLLAQLVKAHCRGEQLDPWYLSEFLGPWRVGELVIETDGAIELLDGLYLVNKGDAETGKNVSTDRLITGLLTLLEKSDVRGIIAASPICRSCSLFEVCGGGYYLHRFGPVNEYNNPSVYCADLQKLIWYVGRLYWSVVERNEEERRKVRFTSLEQAFGADISRVGT